MTETLTTINQVGQIVLTVCGIAATIIAALAGSRWGKSKAVTTAATATGLLQQVATIAVKATEQTTAAGSKTSEEKKGDAVARARGLLPEDLGVTGGQLSNAIEAAVQTMNDGQAKPEATS